MSNSVRQGAIEKQQCQTRSSKKSNNIEQGAVKGAAR